MDVCKHHLVVAMEDGYVIFDFISFLFNLI